jgi:membrane-associated protease RseP (regulator of RpoE activity)
VALANMMPAWIFDGGRFFYISVFAIVKKEKITKVIFKISNYIILAVFLLLMILWAYAFLLV